MNELIFALQVASYVQPWLALVCGLAIGVWVGLVFSRR